MGWNKIFLYILILGGTIVFLLSQSWKIDTYRSKTETWLRPGKDYRWVEGWTKNPSLNDPRAGAGVVAVNGYIYIIGGGNYEKNHVLYSTVEFSKINSDGSLGEWKYTSPMSTRRMFAVAVEYNGYIYAIGGESEVTETEKLLDTVERAKILPDGSLGPWVMEKHILNTPRRAPAAVVYNKRIYVSGGFNGIFLKDGEYASINSDGALQPWNWDVDDSKVERYIHTGIINKNNIYLFGGHIISPEHATTSVELSQIDAMGKPGAWHEISQMIAARFGAGTIMMGDFIYMIGGQNTILVTSTEKAPIMRNGKLGGWTQETRMNIGRVSSSVVSWNDVAYVIGGSSKKGYLRESLRAYFSPGKNLGYWTNYPVDTKVGSGSGRTHPDALEHFHSGWKYYLKRKYDRAIIELDFGIRIQPKVAQPHNLLGLIYREKKMYEEAIKEFKLAIQIDPTYIRTYYEFGVLYSETSVPKKAEDMFKKALKIDPKFNQARFALAKLLAETGRCEEAGSNVNELKKLRVKSDMTDFIMKPCKKP